MVEAVPGTPEATAGPFLLGFSVRAPGKFRHGCHNGPGQSRTLGEAASEPSPGGRSCLIMRPGWGKQFVTGN